MFHNDTVKKFLGNRHRLIVEASNTLDQAFDVMERENTNALGVTVSGNFVGILTCSDLVRRVLCESTKPRPIIVNEVITANPFTVGPSITLKHSYDIMLDKNISHLPVLCTNDNSFLGIVTEKDLRNDLNIYLKKTASEVV